jgi:two-component system, chemotaxis family, protein-glutamate methylesterase/glutaminase
VTSSGTHDLVAIGTSWGGLEALRTLLGGLPSELEAAVVVAQHRGPESHPTAFRDLLRSVTRLHVCEADDKEPLRRAVVFLAPPDYHLLVEGEHLALSTAEAVAYSRPSIDVLFESAAEAARDRCVGVVLTGANEDGARGAARIRQLGGTVIVQDPAEAERPEMPRAAADAVPDATIAPLAAIPDLLVSLCGTTTLAART